MAQGRTGVRSVLRSPGTTVQYVAAAMLGPGPAAGKPVLGPGPAAGKPVLGPGPAAGKPVLGSGPAAGKPVLGVQLSGHMCGRLPGHRHGLWS